MFMDGLKVNNNNISKPYMYEVQRPTTTELNITLKVVNDSLNSNIPFGRMKSPHYEK